MIYVNVDRIEEGKAVCFDETGRQYIIPSDPDGIQLHEGDIISVQIEKKPEDTEKRLQKNRSLWEKIKNKGDKA